MKKVILSLCLSLSLLTVFAHEGIWIPMLLEQLNEADMKSLGMKISAQDIYSINKSCLKDGIVLFGGGCTAEIISDKGLILTNHHCGYGSIQRHSSVEFDYLTNGFWAGKQEEELSNPGLSVTLLIRMEDVSAKVLEGVNARMTEAQRAELVKKHITGIEKSAVEGTHYKAKVKSFYYGNQYFLFITEVFTDIRLVGAPPSNIGKFGGDTDNWMWPRHTGDFSVFRIYANKNNEPADYSKDNVPYKPKYHLPISLKGEQKGDFTFVFGYPGTTQEYLPSYAVNGIANVENPAAVKLRQKRLEIMDGFMKEDNLVRIQYSNKYQGVANYWKKMMGESRGIQRINAIAKKQQFEKEFQTWADADNLRKEKYGQLLPTFEAYYIAASPLNLASTYFFEAGLGVEIVKYAYSFNRLVTLSKDKTTKAGDLDKAVEQLKGAAAGYFKNYHAPLDQKVFAELLSMYHKNLPTLQPSIFGMVDKKYKGDFAAYAQKVFGQSIFASEEKVRKFLDGYKASRYKKIEKDPAFQLSLNLYNHYLNNIQPVLSSLDKQTDSLQRIYMQAQMEFQPGKAFFPDANSTLRVAYGQVDDFSPADAVKFNWFTTLDGIMQKEDPAIYDYVVEKKLKELYNQKDYGRYGDKDGSMHVAFIASNQTTGGNSGSPVLNADGQLIGINFDRNWEGTMSDLMYDPSLCRNISLDIRYCLFIIDKYAGARRLIDEMTIVE